MVGLVVDGVGLDVVILIFGILFYGDGGSGFGVWDLGSGLGKVILMVMGSLGIYR